MDSGTEILLQWQKHLRPLRVDLIGDFAGKDLFAIHGDSLMLHCIWKARVDFTDGFQLLHAVHAVETFLANLRQRGYASNSKRASNLHRLARAVLVEHFRRLLAPGECTDGTLQFEFDNVDGKEFRRYLACHTLRFWLCLDGVAFHGCSNTSGILFVNFMNSVAARGLSIALLNDLEFVSSKVFASVTSASSVESQLVLPATVPPRHKLSKAASNFLKTSQLETHAWSPRSDASPLSGREMIALVGIGETLSEDSRSGMKRCAAAFILHLSALRRCDLSERSCAPTLPDKTAEKSLGKFLGIFSNVSIGLLDHSGLLEGIEWDLFDLVDGRVLLQILRNLSSLSLATDIIAESRAFAEQIKRLFGFDVTEFLPPSHGDLASVLVEDTVRSGDLTNTCILPFSHPILDVYLHSVDIGSTKEDEEFHNASKVCRELSHWHNARVSVDRKKLPQPKGFWAQKRNQMYMADTIAYSASLTSATGKILDPETIVTSLPKPDRAQSASVIPKPAKDYNPHGKKGESGPKSRNPPKSGKERALEEAQRIKNKKLEAKGKSAANLWNGFYHELEAEDDLFKRFAKASKALSGLDSGAMDVVGGCMSLYICGILWLLIREGKRKNERSKEMDTLAIIWSRIVSMEDSSLSESAVDHYRLFLKALQIQQPAAHKLKSPSTVQSSALSRAMVSSVSGLKIPGNSVEFQLEFCGPYMERSFDPAPDPRVPFFHPDAWQRKVLDAIDVDKSLFVVAPTSAGKTFISFYAMKKVLQASDDGILVYVAPTKALVNQIAAEIQARFSKSYANAGKSVWSIYTRDYRVNSTQGCQILVTVPHMLQILLLAPSNAEKRNPWSERIKRIIFDEVHCIGQTEEGVIWEQLLLMAPCPIIALSATVGNVLEFKAWLEASEKSKGFELAMVSHSSRYSDLRKYIYRAPVKEFTFKGLLPAEGLEIPGLNPGTGPTGFCYIHPVASLINRNRGTIEDIGLEPRDCLLLWRVMMKHQTKRHPVCKALDPSVFFPATLKKSDVARWEHAIKDILTTWMQDANSPFQAVRQELASPVINPSIGSCSGKNTDQSAKIDEFSIQVKIQDPIRSLVLPLATDLHERKALPAIFFNYDRDNCERTVATMIYQLEQSEEAWKVSCPEWGKKLKEYEKWKLDRSKIQALKSRPSKVKAKNGKSQDDAETSKQDSIRDEASQEASIWESFDPDGPVDLFSFADRTKLADSELEPLTSSLANQSIDDCIINALRRGIGVHHSGMNRKYRQVVEMLFRKGFLRVVIATGTLALGINMPCKTVVFLGDSVFLTALNYLQAAGRAGRRGFDVLGNVVFAGMTPHRAFEIMSSRLPDLRGHFPLSTTLVLRLFGLLHHTNNSGFAVQTVRSLLSQTRLYLGGPSNQLAIKHHLRFSIEYLRRQHLLSREGAPLNFSGLVGHLYFTQNAVFAFHTLLKEGYFHQICADIHKEPKEVLRKLILVMAHLFCRIPKHNMSKAWLDETIRNSPSMILLPRMPRQAECILFRHNQETLSTFRKYVCSYIKQHLGDTPDTKLPFTGHDVWKRPGKEESRFPIKHLAPTKLRSPFAALSGFTDEFDTIHELCTTIRSGVFLDESAVPYVPIYPHDVARPWNAYIYDFFKHGDLQALVRDNRIKRGDVWFHLRGFSLILATIVTSLTNFLNPRSSVDAAEARGAGDAIEDEANDSQEDEGAAEAPVVQATPRATSRKASQKAMASSWDDELDDEQASPTRQTETLSLGGETASNTDEVLGPAWQKHPRESLMNVLAAFQMAQAEFDERFHKIGS